MITGLFIIIKYNLTSHADNHKPSKKVKHDNQMWFGVESIDRLFILGVLEERIRNSRWQFWEPRHSKQQVPSGSTNWKGLKWIGIQGQITREK